MEYIHRLTAKELERAQLNSLYLSLILFNVN